MPLRFGSRSAQEKSLVVHLCLSFPAQTVMKSIIASALLVLALASGTEAVLRFGQRGPAGPGQPEPTKAAACAECKKHAPYLDTGDDCFCHASDIMTTFANDATKKLTTRSKYGSQTQQTGADSLASGWMWHCRKISATEGVWQSC